MPRDYYDVHCFLGSEVGERALADGRLAVDSWRHARMFFNSIDLDLTTAEPRTFELVPAADIFEPLRQDYEAMTGMIFGQVPTLDAAMEGLKELEERVNG